MTSSQVSIRHATLADLPFLSAYGEQLARQHHAYDPDRFLVAEPAEMEFTRFFTEQMASEDVRILIAMIDGAPVGYAFLRWEPASFVDLAGPCVWLHDLYLGEAARGLGAGAALIDASKRAAWEMGSPALMLSVSPKNRHAQGRFEAHGFRATMLEMRVELEPDAPSH